MQVSKSKTIDGASLLGIYKQFHIWVIIQTKMQANNSKCVNRIQVLNSRELDHLIHHLPHMPVGSYISVLYFLQRRCQHHTIHKHTEEDISILALVQCPV